MLTYAKLANFGPIYEPIEFSMHSTREQRDRHTISRAGTLSILPVAGLFGANASGKSTFVQAFAYLRHLLFAPRREKDVLPLVAHGRHHDEPTIFDIEFLQAHSRGEEVLYNYSVTLQRGAVVRESLATVTPSTGFERPIFTYDAARKPAVELHGDLKDSEFAQGVAATRSAYTSQILFSVLAEGVEEVSQALEWFRRLNVIAPESKFVYLPSLFSYDEAFSQFVAEGIGEADSGIMQLSFRDIDQAQVPVASSELEQLRQALHERVADANENTAAVTVPTADGSMILMTYSHADGIRFRELVARHDGFDLSLAEESRGTSRYLHLLPILYSEGEAGVYLVDELDAALHPHLVKRLVRSFAQQGHVDSRRQLIFTSHALELLFLDELRRDEVWFIDKVEGSGEMTAGLTRLSEFEGIRKGSDVVSLFMGGRLGGIPRHV